MDSLEKFLAARELVEATTDLCWDEVADLARVLASIVSMNMTESTTRRLVRPVAEELAVSLAAKLSEEGDG